MFEAKQGSYKLYVLGFILSALLTLLAYAIVSKHLLKGCAATTVLFSLGVVQALVQLILFLHLGQESKPRWNLVVFLFMLLISVVVVIGSLWIMYNLDYRMM